MIQRLGREYNPRLKWKSRERATEFGEEETNSYMWKAFNAFAFTFSSSS